MRIQINLFQKQSQFTFKLILILKLFVTLIYENVSKIRVYFAAFSISI